MPWEDILKQLPSFIAAMFIASVLLRIIRDLYERYITDLKERLKEALEAGNKATDISRQLVEKVGQLIDRITRLEEVIEELQKELSRPSRVR